MQKRSDQITSKISTSNTNSNSLHVANVNLDNGGGGIGGSGPAHFRLNNRNKSAAFLSSEQANNITSHHGNQSSSVNNNININNNSTNNTSLNKMQNLITKNFIDFNLLASAAPQAHHLVNKNRNYIVPSHQQQVKLANSGMSNSQQQQDPSNKLIEDILAQNRRVSNFNRQPSITNIQLPSSITIINRSLEEKFLNPDKLIAERRNLTGCPIIENDDSLKLINYQHNQIRTIQNLDQMRSLIFLDLYDNQIEKISGLDNLINLRVLMLGKNRIHKIENINHLIYLDILDLHGNEISKIENMSNLNELRVLNLASNQIKVVENLNNMSSLIELNLKRNEIADIVGLEYCPKLQRLFLSYNEIYSVYCFKNAHLAVSIQELTLDNNSICRDKNYRRNVLASFAGLRKLDNKRITDEEKRVAERTYHKEESKKREIEQLANMEVNTNH